MQSSQKKNSNQFLVGFAISRTRNEYNLKDLKTFNVDFSNWIRNHEKKLIFLLFIRIKNFYENSLQTLTLNSIIVSRQSIPGISLMFPTKGKLSPFSICRI